ncbi:MAG: class I SAM-dependent methyltransferase [Saprospiraceae bacterium]
MMQIPDKQIEPKSHSSNGQTDRLGGAARRSLWKLLTALYGPATRAWFSQHLKSIENGEGLFLGCGTGEETFHLANLLGKTVRLCGLDEDAAFVEEALLAKSFGKVGHVHFHQASLAEWNPGQGYDFIFTGQTTPSLPDWQLIAKHLKPGGELFAQVLDFSGFNSFPYNHAFARSIDIIRSLSELPANAAEVRGYLTASLRQAGLDTIELTSAVPAFMPSEFNSILSLVMEGCRASILPGNHATREELNSLLLELKQHETQEDTLISRPGIWNIRAKKSR